MVNQRAKFEVCIFSRSMRYCRCKILAFWLESAYSGQFLSCFGDFDPWNWYRCSNPQRNAIFAGTRVLRYYSSISVQRF